MLSAEKKQECPYPASDIFVRNAERSKNRIVKTWDHGDMSELFWIHLGRYVKEPNPESLNYMDMAYRWACHDSHGLSNSFSHALKWAGIDLWAEDRKWAAKQKEQSE